MLCVASAQLADLLFFWFLTPDSCSCGSYLRLLLPVPDPLAYTLIVPSSSFIQALLARARFSYFCLPLLNWSLHLAIRQWATAICSRQPGARVLG